MADDGLTQVDGDDEDDVELINKLKDEIANQIRKLRDKRLADPVMQRLIVGTVLPAIFQILHWQSEQTALMYTLMDDDEDEDGESGPQLTEKQCQDIELVASFALAASERALADSSTKPEELEAMTQMAEAARRVLKALEEEIEVLEEDNDDGGDGDGEDEGVVAEVIPINHPEQ